MTARVIDLDEYRRSRKLDYPPEPNDVLFEGEEGIDWIIIVGEDEWDDYLTFL